ncbi:MAG: histidine kinase [Actinomycetota bacterium]|nr:histidine kinase [Actinomycetota bacterium]
MSALAERYSSALETYLSDGAEDALHQAYEIGREALEAGIGPLVLFSMHRDVVQQLPPQPVVGGEFVTRVTTVFIEALAPFQMTAEAFDDAHARLTELGTILEAHTKELEAFRRRPHPGRDPQALELETMVERHALEIEDVRQRLAGARRTPDTRRQLLADIVHAQEEERRRLAGDIHDDAVQAMTAVLLRIGLLGARLENPEQVSLAEELEESVRDTIARLRRLIVGLSPPELDRAGLASAVRSALDQLKLEFEIDYTLENRLVREPGAEARTIAYRIIQEALANTRKHASASRVKVTFESQDDGMWATVTDDGLGFEVEATLAVIRPGHLGLKAMRERAELADGWLRVESGPEGTAITFWLPERQPADVTAPE